MLRPTGELRFYEHVRSQQPRAFRRQRLLNPLWRLLGGGCDLTRDTERAVTEAGFAVTRVRRFAFLPNGRPHPASPSIIGVARPPAVDGR
ncbi:hypothetical protein [Streptomyces sp. NPDC048638]|uniref:hypothetical protein n=1 Tax=Streptomyces sp. NPDC048638 TaxID=3365580 RepID=UPI0037157657